MEKLFNAAGAIRVNRLQPTPHRTHHSGICGKCRYVNNVRYSFCTNCGWPIHETPELLSLYHFRAKHRKDLLQQFNRAIYQARIALYVIGALCTSGIGFLFNESKDGIVLFLLSIVMAALFILLGRWSRYKPFTALLISFVVVITFSTISVFGRLLEALTTINGLYTIMLTMIIVYYLLRGVQASYKADLVLEEMEIV